MEPNDTSTFQETKQANPPNPQNPATHQSRPILQPIILGDISLPSATTQTTVGSAGSASSLPASPTGYLTIIIGNSNYVIPYYAAS